MLRAEDRLLIDSAAKEVCDITEDENGKACIALSADYMDTNEGLLQLAYDHRSFALASTEACDVSQVLRERIAAFYADAIAQIENDILQKAGHLPGTEGAEAPLAYLRDAYTFQIPYDHYLDQPMRVNLMLDGGREGNQDFISIYSQAEALSGQSDMDDALSEKTALSWLISQQGYTMSELKHTMQDYIKSFYGKVPDNVLSDRAQMQIFHNFHSFFLSSVCREFENMTNSMNTLTVLADISMKDFCAIMTHGQELILPKDTVLGFFSPWQGGGSTLEIQLEKDLVLPTDLIWDVQVEGADLSDQHALSSVYGLPAGAWKQALELRNTHTEKENQSFANVMRDAAGRKQAPDKSNAAGPRTRER